MTFPSEYRLIGLHGPAGCGKDTVGAYLRDRYEFGCVAFADPLYEMISVMTGRPVAWLKDRANKEVDIPGFGASPRKLLQTLGTDWGRDMIHPEVWVRIAAERVSDPAVPMVLTDVRLNNEAEMILGQGGSIFHIHRGALAPIEKHRSEDGIRPDYIDAHIRNDLDFEHLFREIDQVILERADPTAATNQHDRRPPMHKWFNEQRAKEGSAQRQPTEIARQEAQATNEACGEDRRKPVRTGEDLAEGGAERGNNESARGWLSRRRDRLAAEHRARGNQGRQQAAVSQKADL